MCTTQSKFHPEQKKENLFFYNLMNRSATSPDLQLLITLNVTVSPQDRLEIVNGLFDNNVTYNDSYLLTMVQIIINTTTNVVGTR